MAGFDHDETDNADQGKSASVENLLCGGPLSMDNQDAEDKAASAQKQFMAAIESVSDGFALFDADDRMVFCNSRFKEMNPELAPKIEPGISFEEMLRDNIAACRILDALGDEEAFIRERMEQHRNPSGPLVQKRRDRRWLEVREERTPEGSTFLVNTDITERKRAEAALRESEARMKLITNAVPAGISYIDKEQRFRFANEKYELLLGSKSSALVGKTLEEAIGKKSYEVAGQYAERALSGQMASFENTLPTKNGGQIWVSVSYVPDIGPDRTVKGFFALVQDITERKQADDMLRESEGHLKRAQKIARVGHFVWDGVNDEVIYRSDVICDIYGLSPEEFPQSFGETSKFVHPDDLEKVRETFAAASAAGRPYDLEYRIVRNDGEIRYVHERSDPEYDEDGTLVRSVGTFQDITERKRAEDMVRQLYSAIEVVAEPIALYDADDRIVFCNETYRALNTAVSETLEPGTSFEEHLRAIVFRGLMPEVKGREEEYMTRRMERHRNPRGPFEIARQQGIQLSVHEHKLLDGRTIVLCADVTERKRAEDALQRAHDELERRVEERTAELRTAQTNLLRQGRLATLGQLTATVSHELRNPLGVIRTSNFIVRDGLNGESPRVKRALERIDRSVIRCDRIIDELLDFTRIRDLEPEATAIDVWLGDLLDEQLLPNGVRLCREFGAPEVSLTVDRDRFCRAVINVFENACQAITGKGDERTGLGKGVLTIKTRQSQRRAEVIFEDSGPGIAPDVLPRIFEPLYSTKGFGVGLGLPVVKQIMEQHGGGIEIETEEGRGTRVCLWLPNSPSTY